MAFCGNSASRPPSLPPKKRKKINTNLFFRSLENISVSKLVFLFDLSFFCRDPLLSAPGGLVGEPSQWDRVGAQDADFLLMNADEQVRLGFFLEAELILYIYFPVKRFKEPIA